MDKKIIDPVTKEIVDAVKKEYDHAMMGMKNTPHGGSSFLMFCGHAQCAKNILDTIGHPSDERSQKMADILKGLIDKNGQ
jgi:hypothetical protein